MILVLLDTNSYLRLAKRVRPVVGIQFGQLDYVLTVHKITEDEVHREPRLRFLFPWFDKAEYASERMGKQIRVSVAERAQVAAAQSVLRASVLEDPLRFMVGKRQPPSPNDCFLLAIGQVKPAIVVTDDLGMHDLAKEFGLKIWHGWELMYKLLSAGAVNRVHVQEIYAALEANGDLPDTWRQAKHTKFSKIFGKAGPKD